MTDDEGVWLQISLMLGYKERNKRKRRDLPVDQWSHREVQPVVIQSIQEERNLPPEARKISYEEDGNLNYEWLKYSGMVKRVMQ